MNSEAVVVPDLKDIIEAESANFAATTAVLGKTLELVQDFEDLYQSLVGFIRLSGGGITVETAKVAACVLHLLMKCRNNFVIGVLNLLRGYRGTSLHFLRGAIEACAFAARIGKHPHMADVWLDAVIGDAEYKKFKEKFTKLFPADDPLLQELYERFDRCSQTIHNSVYSMAGHFSYTENDKQKVIRFNVFDLPEGHGIVSSLYFTLDTHKRILKKLADVLADNIRADAVVWETRYNAVEAKLDVHREQWKTVIFDPRQQAAPPEAP